MFLKVKGPLVLTMQLAATGVSTSILPTVAMSLSFGLKMLFVVLAHDCHVENKLCVHRGNFILGLCHKGLHGMHAGGSHVEHLAIVHFGMKESTQVV